MGTVGAQEMVVIFLVALVLFGPKKLPELGRTVGKAITEFRRASNDLKATFEREMRALEQETQPKETTAFVENEIRSAEVDFSQHQLPPYGAEFADAITANPSTVSASEVPGAESQGTAETVSHEHAAATTSAVEGTVPRTEVAHTAGAVDPAAPTQAVDTHQHQLT